MIAVPCERILMLASLSTSEETAAQNEEDVGEDGAEHAGLDDADLAVSEGDDADLFEH